MEKSAPTRLKLLKLRGQYGVIGKGLELIKSKREALMKEFFGVVEESLELRERLTKELSRGKRRIEMARALSGDERLDSFAHSARRVVSLDISVRNIWGVNVPEIEEKPMKRSLNARDTSPVGEEIQVLDVARDFESVSDLIVKIASKEVKLSRIGEMIRADTRKINAIMEIMMPGMKKGIRYIERVLEEREREEVFRLKRFKKKAGEL